MFKSTTLASAITILSAAWTSLARAQEVTADTIKGHRALLAVACNGVLHSQVDRYFQRATATDANGTPRHRLLRHQDQSRVLQQEVAEVSAASGGAEVADFKELLLAEIKHLEEVLEDPRVSDDKAEAQFFEACRTTAQHKAQLARTYFMY